MRQLLLLFTLIGFSSFAQKSIEIDQFGKNSGITQPFIYSINQDNHGYLWIGTGEGVFKYNGFEFQPVFVGDSLTENYISIGYTDTEGRIWWGHQEGGLTSYKDGDFVTYTGNEERYGKITAFSQDESGDIWYALQSNGVVHIDENGEFHHYKDPFENMIIYDIEFAYSDLMLIATDNGLFLYQAVKHGPPRKVMQIRQIPTTTVHHISKANAEDNYWIGTEDEGLFKIKVHPKTKGFIEVMSIGEGYSLNDKFIKHILEDRNGNLWISTYGDGIFKASYSASSQAYIDIQLIGDNYKLSSLNINMVFEDREGNIWAGSHGGSLYFIKDNLFEQYIETLSNHNFKSVRAILVDSSHYYYGTRGRVIIEKKKDNTSFQYDSTYGVPNNLVTAIYKDKRGDLWLGTDDSGTYVLPNGAQRFKRLELSLDNLANSVNSITGGDQFIWIATKFGLFKYNTITDSYIKLSTENQLKHNNISQLYKDPKTQDIWVATQSNYLSRIRGNEIVDFMIKESSSILNISSVCGDSEGDIWIATLGNGVYRFDKNKQEFYHFDLGKQLLSDYCYSLIVDDSNHVWIGHRGGISRINPKRNEVKTYGPADGFTGDCYSNSIFKDDDNNIWFGTNDGAFKFVQTKDIVNTIAPLTDLIRVFVASGNEENYYQSGPVNLAYGTYKIRFEFIGLSFKNSNAVTYSYRLKGHEQEWTELSTNNFAQYNNLAEGEYTFEVKSCNSDGYCSVEATEFSITIETPIWKKWWFIALCVLLVVVIIFSYIRYRDKRQKQIQLYLQTELDARTREVVHQKEQLEHKNKDITDSINYAQRIQRAVIPKYTELKAIFPESYVFFKPRDIVSGDFYWMSQPNEDTVLIACADATGHGVPGAFMSLIGSTVLQDAVRRPDVVSPQHILETLEEEVLNMLTSDGKEDNPKDGMDISVCEINIKTNVIRICSAMRPVFLIIDGELINVKANRNPIGGGYKNFEKTFDMETFQLKKGDGIYMFTDGYPDQFGGENGKKFKVSKLKQIFLESHGASANEQYEKLDREFYMWTEGYSQIDDVLVIGITL